MQLPARFENINALRAVSAVGIAMMHYLENLRSKPDYGFVSSELIPWMTDLVFLFFMISAFGMCCGYYEKTKAGNLVPRQFYAKRYSRILPFFILLTVIDISASFSWESVAQGVMNSTLLLSLMPVPQVSVIGVGWFLGTIFLFYMLFPYFVFLLDTKRKAWLVLLAAFGINLLCYYYFFTSQYGVEINPTRKNILYSAVFLIAGGIVYLYKERIFALNSGKLKHLLGILTLSVTVIYFIVKPAFSSSHPILTVCSIIIFSLWLAYAVAPDKPWMHNRVIDFMSRYSMEVYLCHMLMFRVVERTHLDRFISSPELLYPATCLLGISLAFLFSWVAVGVIDRMRSRTSLHAYR